ncbi:MAG: DUF1343 domain-containing protein [Deltaproteobacteria bacterium]|nr:DUF1343 domain-containing protein [Deltaproteobacteria bacterium]
MAVLTGLDLLENSRELQDSVHGKIAYVCHPASVNRKLQLGVSILQRIFKDRFVKIFSPQHGFRGDVQANMIESQGFFDQYFKLKIISLYAETRQPTPEMLDDIDTIIFDLQDVGTRVYTYIHTLTLLMEACQGRAIEVIVLDRPNPINGVTIEGNLLDPDLSSFVGRYPLPMRHGLTIGEVALYTQRFEDITCQLRVVPMQNWERALYFDQTKLPWVLPSPNVPSPDTALVYPGMVIFEGTSFSEGRGTTRPFEIFGDPTLDPYASYPRINKTLDLFKIKGVKLRPLYFLPTFDKYAGTPCGGYQIHITNRKIFKPWRLAQVLCRELRLILGDNFAWLPPPYGYEHIKLPIDILNGSANLRNWVERNGSLAELDEIERHGISHFLEKREEILLYRE